MAQMYGNMLGYITHTQRVKCLYKRALRNVRSFYDRVESCRYRSVLMRQRFEENKSVKDPRLAAELVRLGEEELDKYMHYCPLYFPQSPGGSDYQREVISPDWVLDYWDVLEKAQYPEYFARREQRKKEFVKIWEEKYGQSTFTPKFPPNEI